MREHSLQDFASFYINMLLVVWEKVCCVNLHNTSAARMTIGAVQQAKRQCGQYKLNIQKSFGNVRWV